MPTKIEWTDETWNVITGCEVLSAGCTNCYAMRLAGTRLKNHPSREGLTDMTKTGPVWNGAVRLNRNWIDQPIRWQRPRMVFVCAHGDLFYENVPDEWIDLVLAVTILSPQHIFQVLTKRSGRMRDYMNDPALPDRLMGTVKVLGEFYPDAFCDWMLTKPGRKMLAEHQRRLETFREENVEHLPTAGRMILDTPLHNVWFGVSVEDQERANERIYDLLRTPAAIRWISAEPLLDGIDLTYIVPKDRDEIDALRGFDYDQSGPCERLDWVVAGGESKQNKPARVVPDRLFRNLRDQCEDAGVPYFQKQMPNKAPIPDDLKVFEWPEV